MTQNGWKYQLNKTGFFFNKNILLSYCKKCAWGEKPLETEVCSKLIEGKVVLKLIWLFLSWAQVIIQVKRIEVHNVVIAHHYGQSWEVKYVKYVTFPTTF